MTRDERDAVLRHHAGGTRGTRRTIGLLGAHDYADLIVAMSEAGLDFPKPAATPAHEANVARASAILQPRLLAFARERGLIPSAGDVWNTIIERAAGATPSRDIRVVHPTRTP